MSGKVNKNDIMLNTRFNFVNHDNEKCNMALYRTL